MSLIDFVKDMSDLPETWRQASYYYIHDNKEDYFTGSIHTGEIIYRDIQYSLEHSLFS